MSDPQRTAPTEGRVDFGQAAHVAACAHLGHCWEQLDTEEELNELAGRNGLDGDDQDDDDTAAGPPAAELVTAGPFCGCQDCEVREVLHAAFPVLLAGLVDHLLTTGHAAAAHELMRAF